MAKGKYNFTSYDLEYKRKLEKKRGSKIPNEEFYKYILKLRKWMKEYIKVVKKWAEEKPYEAEQLSQLVKSWEERDKNKKLRQKLGMVEDKNNSSLEMINDYKEIYQINYLRNWALFLSTIICIFTIKTIYKNPVV